jgi:hypothetical protein
LESAHCSRSGSLFCLSDCILSFTRSDPRVQLAIREKEFYNNARDLNGLWLLGIYGIAAVDAYVGAHMLEFDVSDNLSFNILPDPINRAGRVHVTYTF